MKKPLKFTENYYPDGFDPVVDCPACDDIGSRDCVKKLQTQLDKTSKQYMWHRVQAQRPSNFNGQLDEFKSTTHSTAIQVNLLRDAYFVTEFSSANKLILGQSNFPFRPEFLSNWIKFYGRKMETR